MPLSIQQILKKDITRSIDGVIKADDDKHLFQEVDEFVITKEIERDLKRLIESYAMSIERGQDFPFNGVWISGYFGSGKSHLLKILSIILGDKTINGIRLRDIFLSKIDDALFKADLQKIFAVPATSVIFNIEQMAEGASAQANDPILFAFYRTFNRMRGYYEESIPIANFERDLDEEGSLQAFKVFYKQENGVEWEEARPKSLFFKRTQFVETFAHFSALSIEDAGKIIVNYENSYSLSVDSFCREVFAWLERQADKRHRINFFVDEVGHYIAGNLRYMLSLQTIVETLGMATGERAWVFVTSQEAIDTIVGEVPGRHETDFSKIVGRFKFRISLTSADVKEVIQRRLLEKNEQGISDLGEFYRGEKDSLRTVFSFRAGAENVQFKDEESFRNSYPFPAYQYDLLQNALHALGDHNAFVGQHVSRGERSMLEIFQDVAKAYKDKELFSFAPFDAMYEGIRSTLYSGLIRAISQAEHNLEDELAKRLIKTLLLVKYVDNFKATPENLAVLLTEGLDCDKTTLEAQIRESLGRLEHYMYIRRTGDVYEYLTNDEKDAEEEIRNINVDIGKYKRYLSDFLFSEIIRSTKIVYSGNGQDYAFQKAIDDETPRGQGDLTIRLITPWHPDAEDRVSILTRAMGRKELAIIMSEDPELMRELEIYFKTESWINQVDPKSVKYARIIGDKRNHNGQRLSEIRERVRQSLNEATFAVGDQEIVVSAATPIDRIERAFQTLVSTFYPNLRMVKENFTQDSLKKILFEDNRFFDEEQVQLSEAEQEMLSWIGRRIDSAQPVTLSLIKDEFGRGTYGWYEWAILCVVAQLFRRQEIELYRSSEVLGLDEVFHVLNQNRGYEAVSIRRAPKVSKQDIERLKKLHFELFHTQNIAITGKECGIQFQQALLSLSREFSSLLEKAGSFPFAQALAPVEQELNNLPKKEWHYFLENYDEYGDKLRAMVDDIVDPVKKFVNGPNINNWREIDTWLSENHDNIAELEMSDTVAAINAYRESLELYKTSNTKRAKDLLDMLKAKQETLMQNERAETSRSIQEYRSKLRATPEWNGASEQLRASIDASFEILEKMMQTMRSLGAIRDIRTTKVKQKYEEGLNQIARVIYKMDDTKVRYATAAECKVPYGKQDLATEVDVDEYVRALGQRWKALVAQGKRIRIE